MKYHMQRIPHDPANGQNGDCFRTSIACMLDMEPEDVPHFADYTDDDRGDRDYLKDARDWLLQNHGLSLACTGFELSPRRLLNYMKRANPGITYLMVGKGAIGVPHCVICCGAKLVHDVSGRGSTAFPLKDVVEEDGCCWIYYLVKP